MKILFQHHTAVPVKTYGGTERILMWLMKELVLLGHEVVLIGHPDSIVDDIGVELIPNIDKLEDWRPLIPSDVDILHVFHTPNVEYNFPYVVTIHGNGKPGEVFDINTIFLSKKHAENHNAKTYVYNGLDFSEYPFNEKKSLNWNNFMFLAKASWKVKNLKNCVKACKKNKKHLQIAGGKKISFSKYIHSHGMIGQEKKIELLRSVDALLFPVRWHEPFGVAVVEAFSQGVPVIGTPFGSLPELISDEAGMICETYDEFEKELSGPSKIYDPSKIRAYAENKFSSKNMALNYIDCYEKVLKGDSLNDDIPRSIGEVDAEKVLPF